MAKKIYIGDVEVTSSSKGDPGTNGTDGVGISSVVQTTESTVSGGTNVITVTKTDGTTSTFNVRNGDAVGSATIVQTTGDSTTSVMSQDGTTKAITAGMQNVKTGTSILFPVRSVTKLNATQVAALNAAEEITIKWVIKSPSFNNIYRYTELCGLLPYYMIRFSYQCTISVVPTIDPGTKYIGKYVNNSTAGLYSTWSNQCVVINRVTGRVRWYQNATLIADETSNDYKSDYFVSSDGYLVMSMGDMETRVYALQVYDSDVSQFFSYPSTNSQDYAALWTYGAGDSLWSTIKGNYRNFGYQLVKPTSLLSFYGATGTTASGGSSQRTNPYYVTFTEGTSVSGTSNVMLGNSGGSTAAMPWRGQCRLEYWYLNISGGTVSVEWDSSNANWVNRRAAKVYNATTGNEVSDYSSIGNGDYIVVFPAVLQTGVKVYYQSGSPTVTETDFGYKAICCVVDMRMDTIYDGNLIDNEADTEYIFYKGSGRTYNDCVSAWNNQVDANITLTNLPIQSVYDGSIVSAAPSGGAYAPPISGDILIKSGNIYYGDAINRVWKQINNT